MFRVLSACAAFVLLFASITTNDARADVTIQSDAQLIAGWAMPVNAMNFIQAAEDCEKRQVRTAWARVAYDCCDGKSALDANAKAIVNAIEQAQAVCEELGCDEIGFVSISTRKVVRGSCFAVAKVEYVCCCPCPTAFDANCQDIDLRACEGQEVEKLSGEAKFKCGQVDSTLDAIKTILSKQFEIALAKCEESGCPFLDVRGICIKFEKIDDETGLASGSLYFACCCEC